jgi:molybdate transport system substrate-binding protein
MVRSRPTIASLSFVLLLLVLVPFSGLSCTTDEPTPLSVFAAAGAKPALDEVCSRYETKYQAEVEVAYGGGGEVLSQMELSHSGDIYVAPEQKFMEAAVEKGVVMTDTVTAVAWMVPAIAVPAGNPAGIQTLADLARPGVRVAVTRGETTLLGKYAPEIFAKAGLADEIGANIITEAARPDNLLTMLILGQVDAGIIWNFYAIQAPDDIEIIYLAPEELTGVGEMRAAVSAFTGDEAQARQFLDFLTSAEAKTVFQNLGYITSQEELRHYWP